MKSILPSGLLLALLTVGIYYLTKDVQLAYLINPLFQIIATLGCVFLGLKLHRDLELGGTIDFMQGFAGGLMIIAGGVIMNLVFLMVRFDPVGTTLVGNIIYDLEGFYIENGIPEDQLDPLVAGFAAIFSKGTFIFISTALLLVAGLASSLFFTTMLMPKKPRPARRRAAGLTSTFTQAQGLAGELSPVSTEPEPYEENEVILPPADRHIPFDDLLGVDLKNKGEWKEIGIEFARSVFPSDNTPN